MCRSGRKTPVARACDPEPRDRRAVPARLEWPAPTHRPGAGSLRCCSVVMPRRPDMNIVPTLDTETAQKLDDELWFRTSSSINCMLRRSRIRTATASATSSASPNVSITCMTSALPRFGCYPSTRAPAATTATTSRITATSTRYSAPCGIFAASCRTPSAEACG